MISFDGGEYGNFDENYYLEMSRPPMKTESFDNTIDSLMALEDGEKQQVLQKRYSESMQMNNYLTSKNNHLKHVISKKNDDLSSMTNQLYLLYILLFVSIILIISQKISYTNLQQLYEIIRHNRRYPDIGAPI